MIAMNEKSLSYRTENAQQAGEEKGNEMAEAAQIRKENAGVKIGRNAVGKTVRNNSSPRLRRIQFNSASEKANTKGDKVSVFLINNPSISLGDINKRIKRSESDYERDFYFAVYQAKVHEAVAEVLGSNGLVWDARQRKYLAQG